MIIIYETFFGGVIVSRTLPPWICCTVIVHEIVISKTIIPTASISVKKLSLPRGNLSNYFIEIIVFTQLYRSESATLVLSGPVEPY